MHTILCMLEQKYRSTRHAKYVCNYHLVWIPKYRKRILTEEVKKDLNEIIYSIAIDHDIKILQLNIMPDHVHLFISTVPRYSPSYLANLLKGVSARKLGMKHPELKRKDGIWTRSYFISTHGHVSSDTIKKYIEEQGE